MNKNQIKPIILASLMALTVSGCDSIPFMNNTPDYKGAGRSRPLEVPPDLTSISANDTYTVPGGSTTYSEFSQGQETPAVKEKILPTPDSVHLERAGSQRWLVVQAPPEKIWPVIREFWAELGFAVRVENSDTGVMETEWVDPSSLTKDNKGNYLDKFQGWLDRLNTLANRQKFRTRLDRGQIEGTTEIYMSHRAVSDTPDDGKVKVRNRLGEFDTGYAPQKQARTIADKERADAEDLDAELLRRLMVRLGVEDQKSRSIMENNTTQLRASLSKATDGTLILAVNDEFDRAWRRVGLALDRVGFVVEDKNRSNGVYFVRYTDVDIDTAPKTKKGLLDSLKFWGDDKEEKKPEPVVEAKKEESSISDKLKFWKPAEKTTVDPSKQYRVKVEENADGGSKITIVDKEGNINNSSTANVIINLLYEQLK
jgi:outer membrane protein assembly factor BamC